MAVTILCPNLKCRKVLAVPDETRGKKVRCRHCGTTFIVPLKKRTKGTRPEEATMVGVDK